MTNRLSRSKARRILARWFLPSTTSTFWLAIVLAGFALLPAAASDAPGWMRALASAPLPDHDEMTDAVLLYSETILVVQGSGKIKRTTREVYKILRVGGKEYGMVLADFDNESKILSMHGWCISTSGRDYAVKESDAVETSLRGVDNGELSVTSEPRFCRSLLPTQAISLGMRSSKRNTRMCCKTFGCFKLACPPGKPATPCNCLLAGSTRPCG